MLRAVAFAKEVSRVLYTENNGTKVRRKGVGWWWGGGLLYGTSSREAFLGTKNCCNYCYNFFILEAFWGPKRMTGRQRCGREAPRRRRVLADALGRYKKGYRPRFQGRC